MRRPRRIDRCPSRPPYHHYHLHHGHSHNRKEEEQRWTKTRRPTRRWTRHTTTHHRRRRRSSSTSTATSTITVTVTVAIDQCRRDGCRAAPRSREQPTIALDLPPRQGHQTRCCVGHDPPSLSLSTAASPSTRRCAYAMPPCLFVSFRGLSPPFQPPQRGYGHACIYPSPVHTLPGKYCPPLPATTVPSALTYDPCRDAPTTV
jgi:hypothetical protein